jgi:hypothetical protein
MINPDLTLENIQSDTGIQQYYSMDTAILHVIKDIPIPESVFHSLPNYKIDTVYI